MDDGYEIRPHVHPAYERLTVLEGTLYFAHGEHFDPEATQALPVGGYAIMAPGDAMFGYAEGETIIQLHGTGPWGIEYIYRQTIRVSKCAAPRGIQPRGAEHLASFM